MNVAAVLERPYMGQPLPDALPDVLPAEALALPAFSQCLREQAEALRQGNVTADSFEAFWEVASQITYYDDGIAETYHGPDGKELSGPDREAAALLCNMRSAEAWQLASEAPVYAMGILEEQKLTIDDMRFVCDIFGRYDGLCELDITADELDQLEVARKRLCLTLGIADPGTYTLGQLIEKATARLELHDAMAAGQFDTLLNRTPQERVAVPPMQTTADETLPDDAVRARPAPDLMDDPDADSLWGESRWPIDSSAPLRRRPQGIRSHRYRPERKPGRVRRWALRLAVAAAAVALAATLHPWAGGPKPVASPALSGPVPTPEIPPYNPPILIQPPKEQSPDPSTLERMIAPGEYDSWTGAGTIWHQVEQFAAEAGHGRLTMTQAYQLTQRTLDYMNERLPGGMSWDKARTLSPDTPLPFPSQQTYSRWLAEIVPVAPTPAFV